MELQKIELLAAALVLEFSIIRFYSSIISNNIELLEIV